MRTVGQILREARDKKSLSLDEAEKATKIRKKILVLLEESNWKDLPSPTFVKGLLKNYGLFLGLDTKKLLAFFRREYDEPKVQKHLVTSKSSGLKIRFTPQLVTTSVIALAILAASFYLFSQYRSFTSAPLLEISEPRGNVKVETLDISVVGKTYTDATLKINGQKIQISPGGTFSVAVSLVEGINTIVITAENRFGKISTEKRTVVVDSKIAGAESSVGVKEKVSLTLKIGPNAANIRIELDGKKTFEGVLVFGSIREISAKERVKIFTSNAGSTKVKFNGKDEVLGKEGESLERTFK